MTPPGSKGRLRRAVSARIRDLDPVARAREEAALGDQFPALPGFAEAGTVLLYASAFADEVDTRPWLDLARGAGKRVVCPRVVADRYELHLCLIDDPTRDLVAGFRSIPEPSASCPIVAPTVIDWALVPGLAFDRAGYRLGRGAGHYDRLLPLLRPEVPTWALVLAAQWVAEVPREAHDWPLSGVADAREVVPSSRYRGIRGS